MDSQPSASSSFDALHDSIKKWIWQQQWNTLREAQELAIPPILAGVQDVIISAPTSAGKTEAAFLPILTKILAEDRPSVRSLYISPLKALINDQFGRLELLCEELDIKVHRWHGDVAQSRKASLLKTPTGVLLITPESLEALFVNHGVRLRNVFKHLDSIVVDEVHSFINTERGAQLRSLMHRLERTLERPVQRIGLSATISDLEKVAEFLRPHSNTEPVLITARGADAGIKAQLRAFVKHEVKDPEDPRAVSTDREIIEYLLKSTRGKSNLIFCNRKDDVEQLADHLSQFCIKRSLPNEYCAHHGNLSKSLREFAEEQLKSSESPTTCVCTSTLEMGIDIGPMDSVVQFRKPFSVASLRQRVGRSGRRDSPAVLRLVVVEREPLANSDPEHSLYLDLVHSVATVELMRLAWVEPPVTGALHLSTAIQQTMSFILESGGSSIAKLHAVLVENGPFSNIGQDRFVDLLRAMKEKEVIEQYDDGTLLLGRVGERIAQHFSFYAAFATPEEYRLVTAGKTLGTLPITNPIRIGDPLTFGGKRWEIVSVDEQSSTITVVPGSGKNPPRFGGEGGSVHNMIREKMREIYESQEVAPYLDETARDLLQKARTTYRTLQLDNQTIIERGSSTLLFHWSGDKEATTLRLLLLQNGLDVDTGLDYLKVNAMPPKVRKALETIVADNSVTPEELAEEIGNKGREKYDWVLTDDLATDDFVSRHIDIPAAKEVAQRLLQSST